MRFINIFNRALIPSNNIRLITTNIGYRQGKVSQLEVSVLPVDIETPYTIILEGREPLIQLFEKGIVVNRDQFNDLFMPALVRHLNDSSNLTEPTITTVLENLNKKFETGC